MSDAATLDRLLVKFAQAEACWFSSTRPDGRAHLAPIWHVWHAGRAYVVTQDTSVRARNIAHHPYVSLALPDPLNVLIVEGTAAPAPHRLDVLQALFMAKYKWDISTDEDYQLILEVRPRKVLAWGKDGDGRWYFSPDGTLIDPAEQTA